MAFAEKCEGAFVGLALGDAYGRPLEFVRTIDVRTHPVLLGSLDWTDDTHMALYLAEVVESTGEFEIDRFAHAWGAALVRWMRDPRTPSTAPGRTCLTGAAGYAKHGDWRTSGVPYSDGCGAPMRIAPLPMRWSGEKLRLAAFASAVTTHAHPNAVAATETLCFLLRAVLDGATVAEATPEAIAWSRAQEHAPMSADALAEAVDWSQRGQRWLDEEAIPPGDGGWRSSSAVGLAVAANLRWADTREMIDKAARIEGDSDSVAAIATMLRGAEQPESLPDWEVPDRAAIAARARRIAALR